MVYKERSVEYILPDYSPDILLVVPPTYPQGRAPDYNPKPPLGLEYLAGSLGEIGVRAKILDADVIGRSVKEVVELITRCNPRVLGMTVLQRALPSVKAIHTAIREAGYLGTIIYGGIGATLCHREILNELRDLNCIVVLGEGEEVLPLLLFNQEPSRDRIDPSGVPSTAYLNPSNQDEILVNHFSPPPDPTCLPRPDRQNLQYYSEKSGYGTFMGGRGCPWSLCTFCSNSAFEQLHDGDLWRPREPEEIVTELIDLYRSFGISRLKSNDANLFGPPPQGQQHVVRMCELLLQAKKAGELPANLSLMSFVRGEDVAGQPGLLSLMRQAGWDRLLLGIESSHNTILEDRFSKGERIETLIKAVNDIRQVGMSVVAGFMIFHPYSTPRTISEDLEFLERHNLQVTLSKSLRVFNGVPMQHQLVTEGRLILNSPFDTYHEYIVPEEVASLYYALKNLHVFIEDPLRKVTQDEIWRLKSQGGGFNERVKFSILSALTWKMESALLKAGLRYLNTPDQDIINSVVSDVYICAQTIAALLDLKLDSRNHWGNLIVEPGEFSGYTLKTLSKPPTNTLREEYIWEQI